MEQIVSLSDTGAMSLLTPQRWMDAKAVLSGEVEGKVSKRSAAEAAGVSLQVLNQWIKRSAEQRATDDPWIHEIAEFMQAANELQAGVLEDQLWDRSVNGWQDPVFGAEGIVGYRQKYDNRLSLRMLEVRDERYKPKPKIQASDALLNDAGEVLRRLKAALRMKQIGEGTT